MRSRWEIVEGLINKNGYKNIAEIGVFECQTASRLLDNCDLDSYLLVDTANHESIGNLLSKKEKAYFINDYSSNASKRIEDGSLDLVFIDACHEYPSIKEDIELWFPKVRKGGIICGHDFGPAHMGVMKAVRERFKMFDLELDKEIEDTLIAVWWSYIE